MPDNVPVAFETGGLEGVTTTADSNAAIRRTSEAVYGHFLRPARATGHGARVPLDVIRRGPGQDDPEMRRHHPAAPAREAQRSITSTERPSSSAARKMRDMLAMRWR